MAAANDSQKRTTVHDLDVQNINGTNVYVDKDGNIVRTEKRKDKRKLFAAANNKLQATMPENKTQQLTPAQLMAMQQQEY